MFLHDFCEIDQDDDDRRRWSRIRCIRVSSGRSYWCSMFASVMLRKLIHFHFQPFWRYHPTHSKSVLLILNKPSSTIFDHLICFAIMTMLTLCWLRLLVATMKVERELWLLRLKNLYRRGWRWIKVNFVCCCGHTIVLPLRACAQDYACATIF